MKDFVVSASVSGKTNYTVTVCVNPSYPCQDNRKYGGNAFCKHIVCSSKDPCCNGWVHSQIHTLKKMTWYYCSTMPR